MSEEIARYIANAAKLEAAHAYSPEQEHDACGVGLVAAIDGKPRREVVAARHRGAESGLASRRRRCRRQDRRRRGHSSASAAGFLPRGGGRRPAIGCARAASCVGQIFLPRTDYVAQETCRTIVETEILRFGFYLYGWRQVPVDISVIGEKANATRPEIEQIMFDVRRRRRHRGARPRLYLCRRRIEKRAREAAIRDFYVCSLSARSLIYKGMFLAEQLSNFYPDLKDERFVSAFAIFHQRYSTNTFPQWRLAQPFRMLAHNGEINTLKGNVNWMKSHEIQDGVRRCSASMATTSSRSSSRAVRIPPRSTPCSRCWCAPAAPRRWPRRCSFPKRGRRKHRRCPSASRDVCLCQRRDGAVGRTGRARRHRRPLGDRRHGSQRPASAALRAHRGRLAVRRLRDRHGRARRVARSCARAASVPAR